MPGKSYQDILVDCFLFLREVKIGVLGYGDKDICKVYSGVLIITNKEEKKSTVAHTFHLASEFRGSTLGVVHEISVGLVMSSSVIEYQKNRGLFTL